MNSTTPHYTITRQTVKENFHRYTIINELENVITVSFASSISHAMAEFRTHIKIEPCFTYHIEII